MTVGDDRGGDQWKVYPAQVVPWTKIKLWFEAGTYVPYAFDHMYELLVQAKSRVHPWIRLNRVAAWYIESHQRIGTVVRSQLDPSCIRAVLADGAIPVPRRRSLRVP